MSRPAPPHSTEGLSPQYKPDAQASGSNTGSTRKRETHRHQNVPVRREESIRRTLACASRLYGPREPDANACRLIEFCGILSAGMLRCLLFCSESVQQVRLAAGAEGFLVGGGEGDQFGEGAGGEDGVVERLAAQQAVVVLGIPLVVVLLA